MGTFMVIFFCQGKPEVQKGAEYIAKADLI